MDFVNRETFLRVIFRHVNYVNRGTFLRVIFRHVNYCEPGSNQRRFPGSSAAGYQIKKDRRGHCVHSGPVNRHIQVNFFDHAKNSFAGILSRRICAPIPTMIPAAMPEIIRTGM